MIAFIRFNKDGTRTVVDDGQPNPVPPSVALWQARVVLAATPHKAGGNMLAAVLAGASPALAAFLEYGTEIERAHPSTIALGKALGLTDAQMDDLFRAADAVQPA